MTDMQACMNADMHELTSKGLDERGHAVAECGLDYRHCTETEKGDCQKTAGCARMVPVSRHNLSVARQLHVVRTSLRSQNHVST